MGIALQALAAKRRGDLFVPLIFRLALRLEQVSWDEAREDAPLAAHALSSAQRLFGTDACVNWFDTGLEAEATGVKLARDSLGEISARAVAPARERDASSLPRGRCRPIPRPSVSRTLAPD